MSMSVKWCGPGAALAGWSRPIVTACRNSRGGGNVMSRLESITRGDIPPSFVPTPGVGIHLMATGTTGALGITTALAKFEPGARLPYHTHPYSEVVVVLEGQAEAFVEGRRYLLNAYDAI